jgi:hypothetical protein
LLTNTCQGVYVNGVDQGTSKGIRTPAYNGAPGKGGYNNGPVKDLDSIDLRCNVMGDISTSDTIKVVPGDTLTFDWYAHLVSISAPTNDLLQAPRLPQRHRRHHCRQPPRYPISPSYVIYTKARLMKIRSITNLHLPRPPNQHLLRQTLALWKIREQPFSQSRQMEHDIRYPQKLWTHEHAYSRWSESRTVRVSPTSKRELIC